MEASLVDNLKALLKRYRGRFAAATLLVIISNLLLILNPIIFRAALEDIGGTIPLWSWAALLIAVAALSACFKYFMRFFFIGISREEECRLRRLLYQRLQRQSAAFFDKHSIGELLSRLTNDISVYRDLLGPGIMYPVFCITLVVPGVAVLFYLSAPLAFLSLIPILLLPLINLSMKRVIYPLSMAVQKGLGEMSSMAQEHFSSTRLTRSFGAEGQLRALFVALSTSLIRCNRNLAIIQGILYPFFALITKSVTVLLVLYAGVLFLRSNEQLTAADFVSFMWVQSYIYVPVLMLGWVLPIYQRGKASYDRLLEIYREPLGLEDKHEGMREPIPENGEIALRGLSFRYPKGEKLALKGLTLALPAGTFVGITGPVGSGKSTLLHLLNREYEVEEGTLFVAGREIHEYPLAAFKGSVASVEQLPFLFSRTIEENISFGREGVGQEELERIAGEADLHETVAAFSKGYKTLVGERGVTLSGGQKQRVALARALLVDRKIFLFDDIFSAVDAATEKRIFSAIEKRFRGSGATVLLVTHRASILQKMDKILYMREGAIIEEGTPQELEAAKGFYQALLLLQRLEGVADEG